MTGLADVALVGPGSESQLTLDGSAVPHPGVVAAAALESATSVTAAPVLDEFELEVGEEEQALRLALAPARAGARDQNFYLAGERLAARAASPATRKQYASIYRTFGDWLLGELDRPPVTSDLTGDAIAAFGCHLEARGGRGVGPRRRAPGAFT